MLVELSIEQIDALRRLTLWACFSSHCHALGGREIRANLVLTEENYALVEELDEILDLYQMGVSMPIQISDVQGFVNINNTSVSFDDEASSDALVSINMSQGGAAVSLPGVAPAIHSHTFSDLSGVAAAFHRHTGAARVHVLNSSILKIAHAVGEFTEISKSIFCLFGKLVNWLK